MAKGKTIITGKAITIKGSLARHKIVKKVVNHFIATEYKKKGKGVVFRYPVEELGPSKLYIERPGIKKNFDFKVVVEEGLGLGKGGHIEIGRDLRKKKKEKPRQFEKLLKAITEIYICKENDVDKVLNNYPSIFSAFRNGAKVDVLLKIIKWLFIMEDIVYWDNEGRAFLYNFLRYVAMETEEGRLGEALEKVKNPDRLKSYMKKPGIDWSPAGR